MSSATCAATPGAYATTPFIAALYQDVTERLPLWVTEYISLDGGMATAVRSRWRTSEGPWCTKVFLGVEANASATITPDVVAAWLRCVNQCCGFGAIADVVCYLCFIDAAGVVSYYACETASE